ncbi:molybdopterin-guanine dinucleotide biosynthesis protein B [Pseudomonadota bacterium]
MLDKERFWNTAPVLAISGFSGSGKTTLIEQMIPHLLERGLKIAVLKHDVHGVQIDRQGKDSDRFYQAGADVMLHGPGDHFMRLHERGEPQLLQTLMELSRRYDLVLVEGHKETPLPKIWLQDEHGTPPPEDKQNIIDIYARDNQRLPKALALLESWLPERWNKPPVYGCILIGGKSTRMGRPKHLLEYEGRTWLEHTFERVGQMTDQLVIVGQGDIPQHLSNYTRLPDIPNVRGPMAGMVAAMRWSPDVSWLMCACDMPQISAEALRWLLAKRTPGVWATLPDLHNDGFVEPLLAHYDPRSHTLLEELLSKGMFGPSVLAKHPKVASPVPPCNMTEAWQNVNSPAELETFEEQECG